MTITMRLEVVTARTVVFAEEVEMVTLPVLEGQIAIYSGHTPLLTQLVPGEMIVRKEGADRFVAVGEGLVQVTNDTVAIVTDMAIPAETIAGRHASS